MIGGQISWVGAVQQAQAPERLNTTAQVRNPRLASWRVRSVVAAFIFDFWVNPVRQEHAARVQSCGFSTCVPMALSRLPGGVGPGQCPILATLERQCGLEMSVRQVRGGTVPGPARKQSFSFHAREGGDQWRRAPARVVAGAAGAVHLTTRFSVDRKRIGLERRLWSMHLGRKGRKRPCNLCARWTSWLWAPGRSSGRRGQGHWGEPPEDVRLEEVGRAKIHRVCKRHFSRRARWPKVESGAALGDLRQARESGCRTGQSGPHGAF